MTTHRVRPSGPHAAPGRRSFGLEYPYRVVGRIRRGVRREWVDPRFRESSRQHAGVLAPGPLDAA
ncbi:MAG TPA: hypothetical protein VJN95_04180 [Gemmatimonadales bacterium]|nr:hypothetical protein [Gemmatimonadales bacterium]